MNPMGGAFGASGQEYSRQNRHGVLSAQNGRQLR